ncbi:MAG: hypothetical protein DMF08_00035 [Verrucomicrobia bacterium]|nr:MAG: hypothetical protein DMF08_00035 [Verrucomicrobiota bacterium]
MSYNRELLASVGDDGADPPICCISAARAPSSDVRIFMISKHHSPYLIVLLSRAIEASLP